MIRAYITRIMERLLANIDWRTAALTLGVLLVVVLTLTGVRYIVRRISDTLFAWRQLRLNVAQLWRDVKVIKGVLGRFEIQLNRETGSGRMSVPPPLPLNVTHDIGEGWSDDYKKTEIRPEPCLPVENR